MNRDDILKKIEETVYRGNIEEVKSIFEEREFDLIPSSDILKSLSLGMEKSRDDLNKSLISIAEFLFSVDAFRKAITYLKNKGETNANIKNTVLIGVAEGEVHDLGKNIVGAVLEASGFNVIDMGRDLTRDIILDKIADQSPSLLALSAMMSTCIPAMQDTITWVRKMHPQVRVIVGGAALDLDLARNIGAHGYASNASNAVNEVRRLIE